VKILYSASNNTGAKIQLARFLQAFHGSSHQLKISAYKQSSPKETHIDWTLDSLLNMRQPYVISLDNDNLDIYFHQIKSYHPDLIISDLEYFTSYIANNLNIPLWQYSSTLINYGLTWQEKYHLGINKRYSYLVCRDNHQDRLPYVNIINNSDRNLVCSHYGDAPNSPKLENNFEWSRPYHQTYKKHVPCQHYLTASLINSNKQIINALKRYPDGVAFLDNCLETYDNLTIKDLNLSDEYYCNLANSDFFVCQGQGSLLADAFYNGKYSFIYPDYQDAVAIINSLLTVRAGAGKMVSYEEDLSAFPLPEVKCKYHQVKYLHELINEL